MVITFNSADNCNTIIYMYWYFIPQHKTTSIHLQNHHQGFFILSMQVNTKQSSVITESPHPPHHEGWLTAECRSMN